MTVLKLNNITKNYQSGSNVLHALKNVSLSVNQGEFIAIIGPSGSGKSTLLSIAGALLQPTEGSILLNDVELASLSQKKLATIRLKEIGFILQSSNLIPYLNVLDQLLLVKKMTGSITSTDKQNAITLLTDLGLGEKLHKMPQQLSGGEKQRVAIARSLMNNPSLILADEPTASLDSARAHEVVQLIAKEVKGRNKAAIMVTHDERMLGYCDAVYRMEDGILIKQDS